MMRVILSIFAEATRAFVRGERSIRFYYWDKHKQSVKKKYKQNEDMRGMLELVQKDINSVRERAEKEIREAERITNEIGRKL